jgi:hypothetical protein
LGSAAAQLRDVGLLPNIRAQHGRLWNRLIVKRLPKIRKVYNYVVEMATLAVPLVRRRIGKLPEDLQPACVQNLREIVGADA